MSSRIRFGAELGYAAHIRGLTLTEVARRAGVAVATASSAIQGRPVNVGTALRLARAVAACRIVPELAEWIDRPPTSSFGLRQAAEDSDARTHAAAGPHEARAPSSPKLQPGPSSQLLISLDR